MAIERLALEFAKRGLSFDDVARILNSQRSRGFTRETFPEFLDAVQKYTSGSGDYSLVNSLLRGTYRTENPETLMSAQQLISMLDEAMVRAPRLENDLVTFRGLRDEPEVQALLNLNPGESFVDKGFGSTSLSEDIARQFTGETPGAILRISNPTGSLGLFPYAYRVPHRISNQYDEMEYLVPRNASYEVAGIDGNILDVIRRLGG